MIELPKPDDHVIPIPMQDYAELLFQRCYQKTDAPTIMVSATLFPTTHNRHCPSGHFSQLVVPLLTLAVARGMVHI